MKNQSCLFGGTTDGKLYHQSKITSCHILGSAYVFCLCPTLQELDIEVLKNNQRPLITGNAVPNRKLLHYCSIDDQLTALAYISWFSLCSWKTDFAPWRCLTPEMMLPSKCRVLNSSKTLFMFHIHIQLPQSNRVFYHRKKTVSKLDAQQCRNRTMSPVDRTAMFHVKFIICELCFMNIRKFKLIFGWRPEVVIKIRTLEQKSRRRSTSLSRFCTGGPINILSAICHLQLICIVRNFLCYD